MSKLSIDVNLINSANEANFKNKTYIDSMTGQEKQTIGNSMLESNDDLRYRSGLIIFPGVIINNLTYRGNLDALDVFEMVCNSFLVEPQGCSLKVETKK
jgi:hypothetical protein